MKKRKKQCPDCRKDNPTEKYYCETCQEKRNLGRLVNYYKKKGVLLEI